MKSPYTSFTFENDILCKNSQMEVFLVIFRYLTGLFWSKQAIFFLGSRVCYTSTVLSGKADKYEYITGEDIWPSEQSRIV